MSLNLNPIQDEQRVLVTGASGFIASHIVKLLLESGFRVKGTVRDLSNAKKINPLKSLALNAKYELELCEADLLDAKSWTNAVKDCTCVIHTASPFPNQIPQNEADVIGPAVNGTLNVLKACVESEHLKVKRVILTSSVAAVSGDVFEHGRVYTETDWPDLKLLNAYAKRFVIMKIVGL